jgi:PmbA protein
MSSSKSPSLMETARRAAELARKAGASDAAVSANRSRMVEVQWRDGKLDRLREATSRSLMLRLYVDGRYGAVSTSDLRPEALQGFIGDAVALTRRIAPDPHRVITDPALYRGQAKVDLQLEDAAGQAALTPQQRRKLAEEIEAGARSGKGKENILSVTGDFTDQQSESVRVHTNGFEGTTRDTSFSVSASVSMKDKDGRRPEDYAAAGARFFGALPGAGKIGQEGAERTAGRLGATKAPSAVMPMVVENRVGGGLLRHMLAPLSGGMLQQKRSFLEGKLGEPVGSKHLQVRDEPHLPRALGSRLFDGEGIAARAFPVFDEGVLRSYYIDTYYGRKLKVAPTTAGPSNLAWKTGDKGLAALLADMKEGFLVTGFNGGNSNPTTGDFSLGIVGHRIRKGAIAEPVVEMNISGNHLELWKRLAAVGNDPYPYSPLRTPTLLFDAIQFAGA